MGGISYLFPEYRLRDNDVLDPIIINQWLIDAAEKYSGNLNEHAFKDALFATENGSLVTDNCFGRNNYTAVLGTPGLTTPSSAVPPFDGSGNEFVVPNHGSWEVIEDLTETITTGQCQLFIVANFNFFWQNYADNSRDTSTAVQFAVRIDGIIEDGTTTGHQNMQYRTYEPYKSPSQRSDSSALPGPSLPKTEMISGIGVSVASTRLMMVTPFTLSAGTHVIEIVTRRVLSRSLNYSYSAADRVSIFTRTMFVFDIPWMPKVQTTLSSLDITPYETEDDLDATRINNDFDYVKDVYNDVQPGGPARGAFNHHHLPNRLFLPAKQKIIEPNSFITTTNKFLGVGSTTITASTSGNGWYLLNDGAGTDLEITDTFSIDGQNCCILILANLQIRSVEASGGGTGTDDFGAIVVLYELDGVVTMANRPHFVTNWWPGGAPFVSPNDTKTEIDVPIMVCIDFSSTPATGDVTNIGLYISGTSTAGAAAPSIAWQRGNLIAIPFRK